MGDAGDGVPQETVEVHDALRLNFVLVALGFWTANFCV